MTAPNTSGGAGEQAGERVRTVVVTRYDCKVHASNRNSDYGVPTTVYAESRQDAANKAIAVAWGGHSRDARVTFLRIEQEVKVVPGLIDCPRSCDPCACRPERACDTPTHTGTPT